MYTREDLSGLKFYHHEEPEEEYYIATVVRDTVTIAWGTDTHYCTFSVENAIKFLNTDKWLPVIKKEQYEIY